MPCANTRPRRPRRAAAVSAHREATSLYALALRYADELPAEERALLLEAYARECNITERRPEGIAARRGGAGDLARRGEPV